MKRSRIILFVVGLSLMMVGSPLVWAQETPKPLVLKSLIQSPPKIIFSKIFDAYLDDVEKRTKGRVKFERYYSASLAKPRETIEAVGSGIADIAPFVPNFTPGKVPLATVGSLPNAFDHAWVAGKAYLELYKTIPAMGKEMKKNNIKLVSVCGTGLFYCLTTKPVQSLKDLKGMKIATLGSASIMKAMGAVPIGMPTPDVYMALDKGTIDGAIYGPAAITGFSMQEAAKYLWKIRVGGFVGPIAVNLDKWNSLPADIRKIMLDVGEDQPKAVEQIYQIDGDNASMVKIKKAGVRVTEPTAEAQAEIYRITKEFIWDKWADKLEAKGLPGRLVMETYFKNIKKYKPLCPFK